MSGVWMDWGQAVLFGQKRDMSDAFSMDDALAVRSPRWRHFAGCSRLCAVDAGDADAPLATVDFMDGGFWHWQVETAVRSTSGTVSEFEGGREAACRYAEARWRKDADES